MIKTNPHKPAGPKDDNKYENLFQDRIKSKQFHGLMQVTTEKKAYIPGEAVHGAVYFQLYQAIPACFLNLSVNGHEKASLKTFLIRTKKEMDDNGDLVEIGRKFSRIQTQRN